MTPDDRRYSTEHEWALVEGNIATVGVTQFATDSLGDIVFLELPEGGAKVAQFGKFGEIESVKAVSDLYSPIGGVIVDRNDGAIDSPELVNQEPYGNGWLIKIEISDSAQLDALMDAAAYDRHTAESG